MSKSGRASILNILNASAKKKEKFQTSERILMNMKGCGKGQIKPHQTFRILVKYLIGVQILLYELGIHPFCLQLFIVKCTLRLCFLVLTQLFRPQTSNFQADMHLVCECFAKTQTKLSLFPQIKVSIFFSTFGFKGKEQDPNSKYPYARP